VSPLRLIQERIERGPLYPWKMLVACKLLNRTTIEQAEGAYHEIMRRWPTPEEFVKADDLELFHVLEPLGLGNRRKQSLRLMTAQMLTWRAAGRSIDLLLARGELYGCGDYARDSWWIFVRGELPVDQPWDAKLAGYWLWASAHPELWERERAGWGSRVPKV